MKTIVVSNHAREQMSERGATEDDVVEGIRTGEEVPAKRNRRGFRKNYQYNRLWGGKTYAIKQVLAIVVEEPDTIVVVTVYTFYF
jgi:hypothetical protein